MKAQSDLHVKLGALAAGIASVLFGAAISPAAAVAADRGEAPVPAGAVFEPDSVSLAKCWSAGTGAKNLTWCVSTHGNVTFAAGGSQIIPNGYEGYAVCSSTFGTHGYDRGYYESAWGSTSLTFPSSTTALLTRYTADGRLKLEMKFSRDTTEFDATIQTTVTNMTANTISDVKLARYAGGGLPGFYGYWNRTPFAAYVNQSPTSTIALQNISYVSGVTQATYNQYDLSWDYGSCVPTSSVQGAPGGATYTVFWGVYDMGNLGPGAKKIVKHVYQRM
jgi:hypothetical protein